jgi:alpha-ketoglutarate-dependent taurine dioxygenase
MTTMPITAARAPLGQGTGLLITRSAAEGTLTDLAPSLIGLLADAGHLLLRGFGPSLDEFNALVERCSARITLDPAREFHGNVAQKVDSGHGAIGLHIENGATPYSPDLLWFHCVVAAAEGSETTVCDGRRVWARLDSATRRLFLDTPVVFARTVGEAQWRQFTAFSLGDGLGPAEVSVDDLRRLVAASDTVITEHADGSIHYAFTTYAAHRTRWSEQTAWANSIFGPSHNYEAPDIRFADGSAIPASVLDRLATVTESVTENIAWRDGDVVLIDNSRVMHGRRAILDPRRTIVNAQSFAAA